MSSIMLNSILLSTSLLFFYILPILFHWSSISTSTCLPSLLPFLHFFTGKFQNKLQTTYHFICKYFSTSFIRKRLFFFFTKHNHNTLITPYIINTNFLISSNTYPTFRFHWLQRKQWAETHTLCEASLWRAPGKEGAPVAAMWWIVTQDTEVPPFPHMGAGMRVMKPEGMTEGR